MLSRCYNSAQAGSSGSAESRWSEVSGIVTDRTLWCHAPEGFCLSLPVYLDPGLLAGVSVPPARS